MIFARSRIFVSCIVFYCQAGVFRCSPLGGTRKAAVRSCALSLVCLAILEIMCFGQGAEASTSKLIRSLPVLAISSPESQQSLDIGDLRASEEHSFLFFLQNQTGKEDWDIDHIQTGCGCLRLGVDKPGNSLVERFGFTPVVGCVQAANAQELSVPVSISGKNGLVATFRIHGQIRPLIDTLPSHLILEPVSNSDTESSVEFQLQSRFPDVDFSEAQVDIIESSLSHARIEPISKDRSSIRLRLLEKTPERTAAHSPIAEAVSNEWTTLSVQCLDRGITNSIRHDLVLERATSIRAVPSIVNVSRKSLEEKNVTVKLNLIGGFVARVDQEQIQALVHFEPSKDKKHPSSNVESVQTMNSVEIIDFSKSRDRVAKLLLSIPSEHLDLLRKKDGETRIELHLRERVLGYVTIHFSE